MSLLDKIVSKLNQQIENYAAECVKSDEFSGMDEGEKQCVAFELQNELSSAGLIDLWSNFMHEVYVSSNDQGWIENDMVEDASYQEYIDWDKVHSLLYKVEPSFTFDYDS